MSATAEVPQPPAPVGRYGGDQAADRRLKRIGIVLGILAAAAIVALGVRYIMQTPVSGEVETFQVQGDHQVQAHLAVDKSGGASGTCTLSALDTDQAEVGRVTVPVPAKGSSYDTVVTIRTTHRATTATLVSCSGG